jgi:hypothetical protein
LAQVCGKATGVEDRLLLLGDDPQFLGFNGSTEFRALSDAELQQALAVINDVTIEKMIEAA